MYPEFAGLFASSSLESPAKVVRRFHLKVAVRRSSAGVDAGFSGSLDDVCCLIPSGMQKDGAFIPVLLSMAWAKLNLDQ